MRRASWCCGGGVKPLNSLVRPKRRVRLNRREAGKPGQGSWNRKRNREVSGQGSSKWHRPRKDEAELFGARWTAGRIEPTQSMETGYWERAARDPLQRGSLARSTGIQDFAGRKTTRKTRRADGNAPSDYRHQPDSVEGHASERVVIPSRRATFNWFPPKFVNFGDVAQS